MSVNCKTDVDFVTLLNSLLVEDANGNVGLNTVIVTEACADISSVGCCGSFDDALTVFKKSIVTDSCGNLAIQLIANTTDNPGI